MKTWHAIFEDGQFGSEPLDAGVDRFDEAVRTGRLDGRTIIGLWIAEENAGPADLSKVYGGAPGEALAHVRAYAARMELAKGTEVGYGSPLVTVLGWLMLIAFVIGIWWTALSQRLVFN